jgi:fatty-acid desaturase
VSSLIDIAFPYRRRRSHGAASFAFTFLVLLFEVELLAFIGVAIAARQLQLWWDLQPVVLPTACLISLAAAAVFWWRARSWSKERVAIDEAWAQGGPTFGQQLAQKRD